MFLVIYFRFINGGANVIFTVAMMNWEYAEVKNDCAEYGMFVIIFESYFSKHSYIIKKFKRQCTTVESLHPRTSKLDVAEFGMGL